MAFLNAFTDGIDLAAERAREQREFEALQDERDTHAAAVRAYEYSFEERETCVSACFDLGATAHAAACQRAHAAPIALPIAAAVNGWLKSIARAA